MNSSDSMPLRAASIVVPLALAAALPSRQRPRPPCRQRSPRRRHLLPAGLTTGSTAILLAFTDPASRGLRQQVAC